MTPSPQAPVVASRDFPADRLLRCAYKPSTHASGAAVALACGVAPRVLAPPGGERAVAGRRRDERLERAAEDKIGGLAARCASVGRERVGQRGRDRHLAPRCLRLRISLLTALVVPRAHHAD